MLRKGDLTQGGITTTLLQFTLPMLAGSLLQQCYNIADTPVSYTHLTLPTICSV